MGSYSMENSIEGYTPDNKKKKRIIAIIIAAVLLVAAVIGFFIYNSAITAVTMRIQRLVGTVNLYNEEGNEQSLREKMRLGAGQTVTTAGESLIMVSLDDTKLMTMEETSKAEIKTRGKKLLFNLLEGNLFFNVTEKLADNESFDVNTTTMVCGIRGTSAYVGRDSTSHEVLMVTDGLVHVVATNPVTKETTEVDVPAGQMITIYLDEEAEGDKTISIVMQSFKEEDLPAMALDTIRKSPELMNRVAKATGFSTKKLTTLAELSSTLGTSMYGSAADSLKASGIEDAIPFMGDRSHQMVSSANSAVNIARDDLPLEVAIIQGYRDVMDVGTEAGYDKDNLASLMDGSRSCMEETFILIDKAGLRSIERINVATRISNTLKVSAGRMSRSRLTATEIGEVLEAEKKLFTDAVKESAGSSTDGSKGSDVLASLDGISDHITGTVDEEMDKQSNGDETVIALLGSGNKNARSTKSSEEDIEKPVDDTKKKDDTKAVANADGNNAGNTGAGNAGANAPRTGNAGASAQEIQAANAAIAMTDPNTGIITLADGTRFDPAYYAAANPDVVARYGTDTSALLAEWLNEGKAQGRPPIASPTPAPVQENNNSSNDSGEDPYSDHSDEGNNENNNSSSGSSGGSGGSGGGSGGGNSVAANLGNSTTAEWINNGSTLVVTGGDANGVATIPANDQNNPGFGKITPSRVSIDNNASPAVTSVVFSEGGPEELAAFLDNNPSVMSTNSGGAATINRVGNNNYSATVTANTWGGNGTLVNSRNIINSMTGSGSSTPNNIQSVTVEGASGQPALNVSTYTGGTNPTTTATVNGTQYYDIEMSGTSVKGSTTIGGTKQEIGTLDNSGFTPS